MKYYNGVPSPVRNPEKMDIIIFRENTEDVYAGIEWKQGTAEAQAADRIYEQRHADGRQETSPPGLRHRHQADLDHRNQAPRPDGIHHALENGCKTVTLVHKGNIQKFTEGAFREWGYELATEEFRDQVVTERESWIIDNKDKNPEFTVEANADMVEPGLEFAQQTFRKQSYEEVKEVLDRIYATHGKGQWKKKIMINDRIADSIFQQIVTRADEYSVLATPEPEWRLHLRRLRSAGRRTRHRSRRQYRRWLCHLRGHPRHRSKICRQRCDQSRLGHFFRGDDVSTSWDGTKRPTDRRRHGTTILQKRSPTISNA